MPAPLGKGLRLAHNDFLCHLLDDLIFLHALLLPKGLLPGPWSSLPTYAPSAISSSNSWCQNSCVRPSSSSTSRARYSGLPHFPLTVPVSPRHSERRPDSLTLTLAPIRASSDLMRNPCPPLLYICASLGVGASGAT